MPLEGWFLSVNESQICFSCHLSMSGYPAMVQLLKIIFDQTSLTRCILCDFLFHLCSGTLELKASLIVFSFFEEKKGRGEECGGVSGNQICICFLVDQTLLHRGPKV